jgi:polysaccharide deacetylase family protein (PEP-CTERM system associated)
VSDLTLNAFSIDLEFWYTAELLKPYVPEDPPDVLLEGVEPLLSLLDRADVRATFFTVGALAERYPELVRTLHARGHEIGCHGWSHARLHDLGEDAFRREVRDTAVLIRELTGEAPLGFRAPTFSLDASTAWALRVLDEEGYRYDSSVFPVRTPLYGLPNAPLHPYRAGDGPPDTPDPVGRLWEFPVAALEAGGVRLPAGGAFYLRLFPDGLLSTAIARLNGRGFPAILYYHPWEGCPATPVPKGLSPWVRFVTYWGRGDVLEKIERLLSRHRFGRMRDILAAWEAGDGAASPGFRPPPRPL